MISGDVDSMVRMFAYNRFARRLVMDRKSEKDSHWVALSDISDANEYRKRPC